MGYKDIGICRAVSSELGFLNVSWGGKTGVGLSLPPFFSMYIKHKKGGVGDHPYSGDVTKS